MKLGIFSINRPILDQKVQQKKETLSDLALSDTFNHDFTLTLSFQQPLATMEEMTCPEGLNTLFQ